MAPIGISSVSAGKHLYVYSFHFFSPVQLQNQISTASFALYLIFRLSWQKIKKVKWFAQGHIMSQNLELRLNPGYSLAPAHGTCLVSKPHEFQLFSLLTWTKYEEVSRKSVLSRNSAVSRLSVVKCWIESGLNQYPELGAAGAAFNFLSTSNTCLSLLFLVVIQEIREEGGFF